jgi:hypothetical protein
MSESSATQWEYRMLVKQTDRQMLLELNQIGHDGWEAIALSYDKDLKGVMNWTCWLKRPCVARPAAPPAAAAPVAADPSATPAAAPGAAPAAEPAPGPNQPPGFDLSDGDFGLKD